MRPKVCVLPCSDSDERSASSSKQPSTRGQVTRQPVRPARPRCGTTGTDPGPTRTGKGMPSGTCSSCSLARTMCGCLGLGRSASRGQPLFFERKFCSYLPLGDLCLVHVITENSDILTVNYFVKQNQFTKPTSEFPC